MSSLNSIVSKSDKLKGVCYDIRGPVLREAHRLEDEGHRVIKLNIGNPAPFGFDAPEELLQDVIHNLPDATGYCHSKGLFPARKAIMQYTQTKGIQGVTVDDIIIGNGVSELIVMAMQALLNNGDEVLLPRRTTPSGPHPFASRAARQCIICAMSSRTGNRHWMICAARSPTAHGHW